MLALVEVTHKATLKLREALPYHHQNGVEQRFTASCVLHRHFSETPSELGALLLYGAT